MFTFLMAAQQLNLEPGSPTALGDMVSRVTGFNLIILIKSPLSPGSTHRNFVLTYEYLSGLSNHTELQSAFNLWSSCKCQCLPR